jgi:hypothetical protein
MLESYHFYPETQMCCAVTLNPVLKSKKAQLFTRSFFPFKRSWIYTAQCYKCATIHEFDGRSTGVLNFNNSYLFDVELFYELMELKVNAGMPTHAWWKARVDSCLRTYQNSDETERLRRLWTGLTNRLTSYLSEFLNIVDYPSQLFACCENPEIICADGIRFANQ